MAIQTADQELKTGIESGELDPIQLEQMIRDTNMADPAKQVLIQKVRSAVPANTIEPTPVPVEQTPSPVSPLASSEQRSFFSDASGTDFFDTKLADKVSRPLPDVKAQEIGFAAAVVSGKDAQDMEGIASEVRTELARSGTSVLLSDIENTRAEEDKAASWEGHWTNKSFLEFATAEPQIAGEILKEAELELLDLKTTEQRARLVTDAVQKLSPEQKTIFNDFKFVLNEVLYQQSLEQTMSRKIMEDTENASLWNWASVLVAPLTAVSSRSDQAKLVDRIGEVIGKDPSNYVFKSSHGEMVTDYLLDPSLTVQEASARLDEIQQVMDQMDYEDLGVNPLHSAELFEVIQSQLRDKNSSLNMGTLYDTADAAVLGTEAVGIAKLMKKAANALSVRVFGQLGGASKKMTEQELQGLIKYIEQSAKPVPVNTPVDQLLTQVPTSVPTGASKREQDIRSKIETLRLSAEGAPTRLERTELETEKQTLGSRIADARSKDTKEQVRVYQSEGLKQKDAKKRAEAEKKQEILNLEAEMGRLQADIDLVDSMAANKSELSRLEQELQSLSPIQIPKTKLSQSISTALTSRGSTLDTLASQNPATARQIVSNAVVNDLDQIPNLGVTPNNIAERIVPTPEEGLGVHQAVLTGAITTTERLVRQFKEELQNLNTSDLLTQKELQNVPETWAKSIASSSQGTLFSTHSSLVRLEDTGDLVVRGVFGGSVDGGFDSYALAERSLGTLFGGEGKIKVRKVGSNEPLRYWDEASKDPTVFLGDHKLEFFVEAENTLRLNSSFVNPFEKDYISPMINGAAYLQTWSRMLQKDLTDSISAYVDKSTRIASIQKQMLEPVLRMGNQDKDSWTQMLMHGDENEVIFSSRAEASKVLNTNVSEKAWDAYTGTRAYYDSVADVRQRSVFKHLDQNGYKSVYDQNGILSDLNGQLHVRPFVQKPMISGRPEDGADALFAPDTVWGNKVWDLTTGEAIDLTDESLAELYAQNKIVARASREAEFRSGQMFDFVVIDPKNVKALSKRPMNIRTGHVDVNYKGQDSWIAQRVGGYKGGTSYKVREVGSKKLNGLETPRETTVGLFANLRQANKAREDLIQDAIRELGPNATEAQIKALSDKYPAPVLTREGENEFGIDTAGTLSGLPAHARKRGERVIGPNGQAEILSLEESLTRSVGEVRRSLAVDAVEVQKRRFAQTYAKHMQGYNGFEADFSRFTWKEEAKAAGIHKEAERSHNWISNLDHAVSNREYQLFSQHIESYAMELMNSSKVWKQQFGELLRDVSQAKLDTELKKITATLLIGTRVLYQTMANTAQAVNLFIHDPVVFAKDTIRRTFASMIGIAGLKIDSRVMSVVGAKMSGMTPTEFSEHLKNLKQSGIIRSASTQDVAALLGETGKIEAGRHYAGGTAFWKRMTPGLGGGDRIGKALMFPQHVATDLANLFAYNHAFSVQAKNKGIKEALSRRSQVTVAGDTRRLMFNQNRIDQFSYQQNAASMQMMFFQHVHRMYNDLIVDPMVRIGTGGKFKISKDGTNPYATGYASSVKTFALMSALWGAGVYPIVDEAKGGISDYMKSKGYSAESLSWFFDGLIAKGLEQAVGTKFDVQSRLTPAGALQTTFDMMFTNDGGLVLGGPVMHLSTTVDKLAKIAQAYWTAEPMDQGTWSKLALSVASSATSGTNDLFRATLAANMMEYVDSTGRPLVQVSDTAWIPVMFSIPPEAVDAVYESRGTVRNVEQDAIDIAKLANRTAMTELGNLKDVTGQQVVDATRLGIRACELMAGSNQILAQAAKENFLKRQAFESEGILAAHADKLIGVLESDKAVQELEKLMEADPQNADVYKFLIDSLKDDGNVQ